MVKFIKSGVGLKNYHLPGVKPVHARAKNAAEFKPSKFRVPRISIRKPSTKNPIS